MSFFHYSYQLLVALSQGKYTIVENNMDESNKIHNKAVIKRGSKSDLQWEKLFRDLEKFLKEYSVREIGSSGLLITSKL